jgi:FPG/IleRS zinc finger protein
MLVGLIQSHRCKSCGLSATVSGGKDIGFVATTETRYCQNCETLVDVFVSLWCKELLHLPESRMKELLELEGQVGSCLNCRSVAQQGWKFGEPCPRCGGVIEKIGDEMIDWD